MTSPAVSLWSSAAVDLGSISKGCPEQLHSSPFGASNLQSVVDCALLYHPLFGALALTVKRRSYTTPLDNLMNHAVKQ